MTPTDALLERLRTAAGVTVFDGFVPDGQVQTFPRAVVYADEGLRARDSLAGPPSSQLRTFQVTTVGVGPEQVRWAQARIDEVLSSGPLSVAGWSCAPFDHEFTQFARRDEDAGTPWFYSVDTWSFLAVPTP